MRAGMAAQKRTGVTKQERVYRAIRERILSGAYGPGYRVVIDALAEEFGVSALPVREAIRRLEAEGLVIYRPNAGAQVAPADPGVFDEEMTVLAVLEGYATALAAPELGTTEIRRLTEINESMVEAMERLDSLRFGRLNQEFHAVIHERCPNGGARRPAARRRPPPRCDPPHRVRADPVPRRGLGGRAPRLIELIRSARRRRDRGAAREHKLHTVESFRAWQAEHGAP